MNRLRVDDTFSKGLRTELVSRVQETVAARPRKHSTLWLAAGALAGAGLLGGIAAGAAGLFVFPGQQVSHQPSALAPYKPDDTLTAFGGLTYDYDPFHSPEALGAVSQLIVQGTVKGVREGRSGTGTNSIVVILHANSVVKGDLPQGNDGNVYLELRGAGSPDPLYYTKALPKGAAVVAYLLPAWDGLPVEGTDEEIDNPTAGRPDGQALFMPAAPQGLILQVGDQDVVWPLIGAQAPGRIADTLPGGGLIAG